jgi:glucose/arabinose dehydrogenase
MPVSLPRGALLAAALALSACGGSDSPVDPAAGAAAPAAPAGAGTPGAGGAVPAPAPAPEAVAATTVATGLKSPWSLTFLPDGRVLVTEREGTMRTVALDGTVSAPIAGVPAVATDGQGGLLDLKLSPDFATDATVYFSFAEPVDGGLARTAVARAVLGSAALSNVQVIYRQTPAVSGGLHFGSRLTFSADGRHLFVTLGERFQRDLAQGLDNSFGKIVRLNRDGSVPTDNPFVGRPGALPELWSYGHRNPQGAAIEPSTGLLWTGEHGPNGGDEINVPKAGANHGWPVITHGREYGSGLPIGEGATRADVEPSRHYWVPTSIAPSGMTFYDGTTVPGWKGDLFVGALAGRALVRLDVENGRVVGEQRLLTSLGERIRDVKPGPDGHLYLVTDNVDGRLMRVQVR